MGNNNVLKMGMKAVGRRELTMYSKGMKLRGSEKCLAKCYECMAGYCDGKMDCKIPSCPLYSIMPYRGSTEAKI